MGKRTGLGAVMGSLITAGVLCFVSTAAQAVVNINIGTGATAVPVTLQSGGASVAGTQNDITYNTATITSSKTCLRTNATTCTADAECPVAGGHCSTTTTTDCTMDAQCPAGETCVLVHEPCVVRPNCTVNAAGKEGFFSFLKTAGCNGTACACTPGTDCTAIRAIIMSLNIEKPTAIADGPLYTCTWGVPAGTTALIPLNNANLGAGDPDGNALAGVAGSDGGVGQGGCIGDKDSSQDISAGEVVFTILAFAQDDVSQNPAADGNMNGSVEANEVVQVIANFAQDSCNSFHP